MGRRQGLRLLEDRGLRSLEVGGKDDGRLGRGTTDDG